MNIQTSMQPPDGLALLRQPFPANQISKLPKETGAQAKQRKTAIDAGNWPRKCEVCGGFHHEKAVHLDYVGHAALTDRLLDADPHWSWEPIAIDADGLPAFDRNGGLWIKLTVLDVTRLGYGDADGKSGGNAIKEAIGDALRNAAMRFGAALDLWHKGDLHADDEPQAPASVIDTSDGPTKPAARTKLDGPYTSKTALQTAVKGFIHEMNGCGDGDELTAFLNTPDATALVAQVKRDAPQWWNGGQEMPAEFVPLHRQIELREVECAQATAAYMTA